MKWVNGNKLFLKNVKTKCTLFYKVREKDIPLKLRSLVMSAKEIKRMSSIKFQGVLIDEHLTWKKNISQ